MQIMLSCQGAWCLAKVHIVEIVEGTAAYIPLTIWSLSELTVAEERLWWTYCHSVKSVYH